MDFTNLCNDFNIYNMKYLKSFNESVDESNIEEIKQTIREILLPISDMGYEISVTDDAAGQIWWRPSGGGKLTCLIIRVVRYTDPPLIMNDEVKEEFIRMVDYLESLGINSVESLYVRIPKQYVPESELARSFSARVDFNEFISMEDCELTQLVFVTKVN